MRFLTMAAMLVATVAASAAHAETFCLDDFYRQTAALVQSLLGDGSAVDRDVIAPPGNIDPQMALLPPAPHGALRIIPPPARPEQR